MEVERINDLFIELRGRQSKPLVIVLPPGSAEPERLNLERRLSKASIAVFPTMERAAKAIVTINSWFGFKRGAANSGQPLQ
jgi:acyl-CoA synthetase (NDP forming)